MASLVKFIETGDMGASEVMDIHKKSWTDGYFSEVSRVLDGLTFSRTFMVLGRTDGRIFSRSVN